jgi:serine phosphatase RsbU (regulator of sigma subunit)/pSer/pThr/pTyr-binding forkhead associated (FHA) protein
MAQLNIVKGVNVGASVELTGERIVLGRNEDCEVVLRVPAVSREHAVIRKIQGKYYIEDLKSRNKTYVNNHEVTTRTLLRDNDRIKICDNILAFFESAPRPLLPEHMRNVAQVEDEEDSSTVEAMLHESSRQVLEAQPAERLALLLDIGAELTRTFDEGRLLEKIVQSVFQVFRQADRAFVILKEEGNLIPKVIKTRRPGDETTARFSRKIVNGCLDTGRSLLSEDASADKKIDLSQSIADCRIRSVMCVPLMSRESGQGFGVIQLDTQDRYKKFTADDLRLLLSVAGQAATALENARMHESLVARVGLERDLRLAHEVQKSFLPKRPPDAPGYEFFAFYEPAQEVGGDYYDFIPLPGGRWGVMVGDVAGKGVPAALLMAKVSSDARFTMLTEPDLGRVVCALNDAMQEAALLDRFVTLLAALVDPATHEVTLVNAGHLPPVVYRHATGTFEDACSHDLAGFPLGVVDGYQYESCRITLGPGDCVLVFTDGITEAKNKEECEFHMDGVFRTLRLGPVAPRAVVDRLVGAVKTFSVGCKQHDDITVVAFGRSLPS